MNSARLSGQSVADLGTPVNRSRIYLGVTVSEPVAAKPFV